MNTTTETSPRVAETAALTGLLAHVINRMVAIVARPSGPLGLGYDGATLDRLEHLLEDDVHRWAHGAHDPVLGIEVGDAPDGWHLDHPDADHQLVLEVSGGRAANRVIEVLEAAGGDPMSRRLTDHSIEVTLPLVPLPTDVDSRLAAALARSRRLEQTIAATPESWRGARRDDGPAVDDTCDDCGQRHGPDDPECAGADDPWRPDADGTALLRVRTACPAGTALQVNVVSGELEPHDPDGDEASIGTAAEHLPADSTAVLLDQGWTLAQRPPREVVAIATYDGPSASGVTHAVRMGPRATGAACGDGWERRSTVPARLPAVIGCDRCRAALGVDRVPIGDARLRSLFGGNVAVAGS